MKTIDKAEKKMNNIEVPVSAINQLAEILKSQELTEIELELDGQCRIKVKKELNATVVSSVAASVPVSAAANPVSETASAKTAPAVNKNLFEVKSPMVGTYYSAPSPDAEPFIKVGDRVKKGDTLCIIEAMKLMNELPSEISGTVKEICVDNSQAISFGEVIIKIEKDA